MPSRFRDRDAVEVRRGCHRSARCGSAPPCRCRRGRAAPGDVGTRRRCHRGGGATGGRRTVAVDRLGPSPRRRIGGCARVGRAGVERAGGHSHRCGHRARLVGRQRRRLVGSAERRRRQAGGRAPVDHGTSPWLGLAAARRCAQQPGGGAACADQRPCLPEAVVHRLRGRCRRARGSRRRPAVRGE